MKKLIFIAIFHFALCICNCALSQNPLVKIWDNRYGGTNREELTSMQQTLDGGYILGGTSTSGISGDKTQATWWGADYWILKTDNLGNKQWDKDFGGTDFDGFFSIEQTSDGGFILGGYSYSGIGGDKTQTTWGGSDYWIVKTDSLGNKQWDNDFGGTASDFLYSVQQTSDRGFILCGYTTSGISGDKTQASKGNYDYWIVKTDSLGVKQWDKDFGGTLDEVLISIRQTSDGGFILGGISDSGIGGDKTQATWGGTDYWLVKTDSLGSKQWDKDFGGTNNDYLRCIQQTSDGGFILGGYSNSGIGGDKTQASWGLQDYWIVKTDSLGNKQWDKNFGGTVDEDLFGNISQTVDGGYLIAGTSYSNISGDKTENNLGDEQTWVIKTDSLGSKQWEKTILSPGHDEAGLAIQTSDGCYAIASMDNGVTGGYKSQDAWNNSYDYWLVKFCDSLFIQANLTATPNICPGTCSNFTNLSLNATAYLWSFPGATPPSSTDVNPTNICYPTPGSYDVQLIASNANGSDTLLLTNYITVYPAPPPQSITQSGDTLFAIQGSASYQWYFNTNIISGATNYFYVAPTSGDYNVVATDANGCEVEAAVFNVVAGIQSTVDSEPFTIFPNPVEDKFTIHNAQCTIRIAVEVSIYNVLGEMVLAVPLPTAYCQLPTCSIDVSDLPSGLYYLEITSAEKIYRNKFVKE